MTNDTSKHTRHTKQIYYRYRFKMNTQNRYCTVAYKRSTHGLWHSGSFLVDLVSGRHSGRALHCNLHLLILLNLSLQRLLHRYLPRRHPLFLLLLRLLLLMLSDPATPQQLQRHAHQHQIEFAAQLPIQRLTVGKLQIHHQRSDQHIKHDEHAYPDGLRVSQPLTVRAQQFHRDNHDHIECRADEHHGGQQHLATHHVDQVVGIRMSRHHPTTLRLFQYVFLLFVRLTLFLLDAAYRQNRDTVNGHR
mmetsp:Transcript_20957/g.33443  ORF Transcript_20957/g.33443 Transcript_20957/m.33443 type:complete len:247 (+) Transcript_20957:256-996(+)